jgi:DNA-binding response OmpR family regulator
MATRLLIVDDDPEITSALARGLRLHGYEAEASNRADLALARLGEGAFEGAIVDVMLGADSGLDLVRAARARGIDIPILMLSALTEVEDRAAGLAAGADDYVVKPFNFEELVARLRVQELRALQEQPEPARLSQRDRRLTRGTASVELTDRETDLLAYLVRHAGQPRPRGVIFDLLWASEGSSSENVVDVYIGYLRKKLAGHEFGFEIKTLRNRGFCLEGIPPTLDLP